MTIDELIVRDGGVPSLTEGYHDLSGFVSPCERVIVPNVVVCHQRVVKYRAGSASNICIRLSLVRDLEEVTIDTGVPSNRREKERHVQIECAVRYVQPSVGRRASIEQGILLQVLKSSLNEHEVLDH